MFRHRIGSLTMALAAGMLMSQQAAADLVSEMSAHRVVTTADGQETLAPADTARPGDVIEYRLLHTNTFDHAISGVAVTGPIPEGLALTTVFAGDTAPATFEVQGDFDPDRPGEEWSTLPAIRIVIGEDGVRRKVTALKEDFTAVRWRLGGAMAPQASVRHAYRARMK